MNPKTIVLALCLTTPAIAGRGAQISDKMGLYVIGDLGPNFVQKISLERILGVDTTGSPAVEVNPGVRGTAGVGYSFTRGLAAGLEAGFSYNETKTYSGIGGGVPLNGPIRLWQVPLTGGVASRPPIPGLPPPS